VQSVCDVIAFHITAFLDRSYSGRFCKQSITQRKLDIFRCRVLAFVNEDFPVKRHHRFGKSEIVPSRPDEVKRQNVCNTAAQLPARRYASTRNEDAAPRAEVSTIILYRLIPTKKEFLEKMMIGYLDGIVSRLSADDRRPVNAKAFMGRLSC
jgi:hypothetical protein